MDRFKIKMWYKIPRYIKRSEYINNRYNKNDYMNLYFFDSKEEMYDFVDKNESVKVEENYIARCYSVLSRYYLIDRDTGETVATDRYSPNCGNLYFVKGEYGVNAVSHECLHATIGYFNRKIDRPERIIDKTLNIDSLKPNERDVDDIEELMCYMHGGLVSQVWECHYKMEDESCIDK